MRRRVPALLAACLAVAGLAHAEVLHDNGPFETGVSPSGNRISELQDGFDTFGVVAAGYNPTATQRVADDFIIRDGAWRVSSATFYGYQTGGVFIPFTSAYAAIFDYDPTGSADLAPLYGSLDPATAPNVLLDQAFTDVFRVSPAAPDGATRAIHSAKLDLGFVGDLPPGQYFLAVGLRGSGDTSTVAVVPVTPAPSGGNALVWGRLRYNPPGREFFWQIADGNIPTGGDPNVFEPYEHAFIVEGDVVATNAWAGPGGGTFAASAANWTLNAVPQTGETASFLGGIASDAAVVVDAPVQLGKINFNNAARYTLEGPGTITLAAPGTVTFTSTPHVHLNVFAGQHAIDAPVEIAGDLTVLIENAGDSLRVGGPVGDSSFRLRKRGAGDLQITRVRAGAFEIDGGDVAILPGGSVSRVASLRLAPGSSLDLADGALILDYAAPPAEASLEYGLIRAAILAAYNGGARDGAGIGSNLADASSRTLGYVEAADLGLSEFRGEAIDGTTVLVALAFYGDTNLDGAVDVSDLGALATNWQALADWAGGDFNYDGTVDVADLGALATNWQAGVTGPAAPGASLAAALASAGLAGAIVPEPGSLALVGVAALLLRRRRA